MTTFKTFGHLGDMFCLTSAAHTYARLTKLPTYIDDSSWGHEIAAMYDDGLLKIGSDGDEFDMHGVMALHRSPEGVMPNYLGCYQYHILKDVPKLLGTTMEKFGKLIDGFEPPPQGPNSGRYLIQPYSRNAPNPPERALQEIVDGFHLWMPDKPLYAIGRTDTPRALKGVDYSMLEDSAAAFVKNVAEAKMVFTPHSAAAHIAAAYNTQAFVWCPDWDENWQLSYPGWDAEFITFHDKASDLILPPNNGRIASA